MQESQSHQIPSNAEFHVQRELHRQTQGLERGVGDIMSGVDNDIQITTTIIYKYLEESEKEITILQGGARSGKTVNTLTWFIVKLLGESDKILSICRASLPTIRGTVLRDFKEIMLRMGIWDDNCFNQTQLTYEMGSNLIEFISTDQPQKIRGRKRNYLFMNECNEIEKESAIQLILRTTEKTVMDYNPSDEEGWFYDWAEKPEADFYITTYKDNPFLEASLVRRIESMQDADDNYWRVFGLGQKGVALHKVYLHWKTIPRFPQDIQDYAFGIDVGFNSPTAVVRCGFADGNIFVKEEVYQRKMTTSELIVRLKDIGVTGQDPIYCDSAAAETIEELTMAGFNVSKSDKDVREGINKVKSMPLYVTEDSVNMIPEFRTYCWKLDKEGKPMDEVVKYKDHALDAMRYCVKTHLKSDQFDWYVM